MIEFKTPLSPEEQELVSAIYQKIDESVDDSYPDEARLELVKNMFYVELVNLKEILQLQLTSSFGENMYKDKIEEGMSKLSFKTLAVPWNLFMKNQARIMHNTINVNVDTNASYIAEPISKIDERPIEILEKLIKEFTNPPETT